jgi:beta-glucosidase
MKKFPLDFMMGASTAAHQVEGNNTMSDFWALENISGSSYSEPSLDAVDHYHRYQEDISLMAQAGLNAYRFSIEWARVEPQKGSFNHEAIAHYKNVLKCCYDYGITPIVTLHHFSSPKWLISEGGWESSTTIHYFEQYCKFVVTELGDLMPYICTINEANMGIQIGRIMKEYMSKMSKPIKTEDPGVQVGINLDKQLSQKEVYNKEVEEIFGVKADNLQTFLGPRTDAGDAMIIQCHEKARDAIKSIYPNIKVGLTLSLYDYQALPGGEKFVDALWEEDFLHYLPHLEKDDFIGIQNYTRKVFGPNGKQEPDKDAIISDMGNECYPPSLAGVLRFASKHWDKELLVTENGVSTKDDTLRVSYIKEVLPHLHDCIEEGIKLIGYLHWSLLDNFEWQKGYAQKFGLIAVDRTTQTRFPKESLSVLGAIKHSGVL